MNLLFLFFGLFGFDHAIYVSVTEVKYVNEQQWEVSCRLFNTDLEDGIRNFSGQSVSLRSDEEIKKQEALIADYIGERLSFFDQDGKACQLKWVRASAENDTVWSYFTLESSSITSVENKLLVELFNGQQNVVTIEKGDEKQYLRFNAEVKRLQLK